MVLFIIFSNYTYEESNKAIRLWMDTGRIDIVDLTYFIHNLILVSVIVIRKNHVAIDRNYFDQAIAIVAVFSGMFFLDRSTANPDLLLASRVIIFISFILGAVSLINLGRSFGFLIALREVKTCGLYRLIRHPMYLTDLLWKTAVILKKPCAVNFAVYFLSAACYVYRAHLEEKFLGAYEEYRDYMERVKYRFIPFIY